MADLRRSEVLTHSKRLMLSTNLVVRLTIVLEESFFFLDCQSHCVGVSSLHSCWAQKSERVG